MSEKTPGTNAEKTVLGQGKFVRLVKVGRWEFAERTKVSGIVGIVAVTDDRKLILVEQYRAPVAARVIEIPAGLVGDIEGQEDEQLAAAANRELEEETGYSAREMTYLAEGTASAGIVSEVIALYRAEGVRKTGAGGGDGSEEITVHEVPVDDVAPWLEGKKKAGLLVDLKVYSALFFVARRGES